MKAILNRAGFNKRSGTPMSDVIFGLMLWLWLKKESIGLKGIDMIENERLINGELGIERRQYIRTVTDVKPFSHAVRAHWDAEHSLHWVLGVIFREDDSRILTVYAHENFNIVR
ncbi:MAG: transposase [Methylococcaceae bacterium NSM2-1]|jgi:hypothetical protein|nr:MAG: transposase [Methylococcaceae bacterium NSM2-1]